MHKQRKPETRHLSDLKMCWLCRQQSVEPWSLCQGWTWSNHSSSRLQQEVDLWMTTESAQVDPISFLTISVNACFAKRLIMAPSDERIICTWIQLLKSTWEGWGMCSPHLEFQGLPKGAESNVKRFWKPGQSTSLLSVWQMNHLPRTESQELWASAASLYLLLGDVSRKAKATNFHRLSVIWNLVDFKFSIQPGISLACSLGLCARNCLEFGANNHLRNSWHHWLASVRKTLALHAEHAAGFMWSGISMRSASCAARSTCDVPGKLAAFLHKNVSVAAEISKSISGSTCARSQSLRLQHSHSSPRRHFKSHKEDRRQESRIRSKDKRCRPMRRLHRQLSRHENATGKRITVQ